MAKAYHYAMKFTQQPLNLLMVRPASFGFNPETASSNRFQSPDDRSFDLVLNEFDRMVDLLQSHEISLEVFQDTKDPSKPDAVFPNNWISFHEDGSLVLYPMMALNRRTERRADIVTAVRAKFDVKQIVDLTTEEQGGMFLEGTGSLVLDHVNRIAYACRSARTADSVVNKFCSTLKYRPVIFDAVDSGGHPIYHTNVMMSVGEKFAVLCLDAIRDDAQQEQVLDSFARTGHKIIAISHEQMNSFAGNIIEVKTESREPVVLLSQTAFNALIPGQVNAISSFADILPIAIPTIEKIGGGSVRCMVAGIHLQRLSH
jgi:hypothetical protein